MNITYKLAELPKIASKIIELAKDTKNVLFYAKMGAGKTTLIKEIIKQLGVTDNVSSPTFSLVNEYVSNNNETIYHFDFYRIKNEEEALDIGIEDYFYKDAWCFIEWPQNIDSYLPENSLVLHIDIVDEETRMIKKNPS